MITCTKCKIKQENTEFTTDNARRTGVKAWCRTCCYHSQNEYRLRMKDSPKWKAQKKNAELKGKYGITLKEYDELFKKQNGVCAICKETCDRHANLSVDHCHTTGRVRGLLCNRHNMALGLFKDSIEDLETAIKYVADVMSDYGDNYY